MNRSGEKLKTLTWKKKHRASSCQYNLNDSCTVTRTPNDTISPRQVENATKVFLDIDFCSNFEENSYDEEIKLLEYSTCRSVSDMLEDQRTCDDPSYKTISEIGVPCMCTCLCIGLFNTVRACVCCAFERECSKKRKNEICRGIKFDIFSLMVLIAFVQQGQNNFSDIISVLSFCFTLTFELLICMICVSGLSDSWSVTMRKFFPRWILSIKPKEANQKLKGLTSDKDLFSPFSPAWWEYSVPFLVYFNKPFSAETRVFYHKVPTAFSPAVLFVRSACNILIIISTIIFRFQAMSYNAKMFNLTPTWNLPFNPDPITHTREVVTEAALCKAVASPKIYYPVYGPIQYNFEMIHTPMLLNFFAIWRFPSNRSQ